MPLCCGNVHSAVHRDFHRENWPYYSRKEVIIRELGKFELSFCNTSDAIMIYLSQAHKHLQLSQLLSETTR